MLDTERETEMKLALKVLLSRKALLGALPVVVALLLSGVISFSYNLLLKNYRDAVDHTFQVMSGIDNVLLRLQDAETGQRGFIITGDDAYLAPFKSAEQELSEALAGLGRLVSDNADQQIEIANLQQLADGKLSELQQTIMTRRNEHRLLEARLSSARWAEQLMVLVAVICVALSLAARMIAILIQARTNDPR